MEEISYWYYKHLLGFGLAFGLVFGLVFGNIIDVKFADAAEFFLFTVVVVVVVIDVMMVVLHSTGINAVCDLVVLPAVVAVSNFLDTGDCSLHLFFINMSFYTFLLCKCIITKITYKFFIYIHNVFIQFD